MAKNYVRTGDVLPFTLTDARSAGDMVRKNNLVGILLESGVTGDVVSCQINGVWRLPKATGASFAQGAPIYVVAGASGVVRQTATGNYLLGVAASAATTGLSTVEVLLKGVGFAWPAGTP